MDGQGKLSIVATPIGNLEDITLRAIRVLKEADVIYCEDTRVTKKLLDRHEIPTPLRRLDAHTEEKGANEIIERLSKGEKIAYVTDAGTPGISDPGYRLVAAVRSAAPDAVIEAIPGASAIASALSIAGMPADEFVFYGFLPHKKGRQTALNEIAEEKRTIVLYESSHRILKLLGELAERMPERNIAVMREVTKKFEEVRSGTIALVAANPPIEKGEFVIVLAPC